MMAADAYLVARWVREGDSSSAGIGGNGIRGLSYRSPLNVKARRCSKSMRFSMSGLSQQCRKLLYRMVWQTPDGIVDAFALRATRKEARRFFCSAISLVSGIHQDELELFNLESFDDLVNAGVSDDEDLRIFETQWNGAHVVGWATRPLFLTPDTTLIARWADLRAELAAAQTNSVISRISGRSY
ncbi:hypothetical protein [Paraburkholderia kirstenboschensis]|uniref:Uncharacterized protein n=1 Tax=Paraburkholderia kirstenboschensis TaxID=1245436 RepID=A0ABZ0ED94_9BURK|nr:hypothetical protein [Paraburkholderia kirstenboschensis]WOD14480.1 hypothetical protein RW095_03165 [Paraburkholderia kirstenboschensis]